MKLPLLLDGATGTRLMAAGMPPDVCPEQWILDNPDSLISIQQGYVDAGCDVLYVPSFGANRVCLNKYGLGDRVVEMNKRLAALTKGVIADNPGRKVLVAGDMSPTGLLPLPWGDTPFEDYEKIYCEQATALYEAGVDLIVCETMTNLTEARAALSAARKTGLPVFVTVTVDKNGRTLSGGRLLPFVITLQSMGAAAVGLNCSNGVSFMAGQLSEALPHAKVPLVAKPNAMDEQGELDPIRFSLEVQKLLDAGATIVGGCCGTSDKHIAALRRILDSHPIIAPAQINANACAVESEAFLLADHIDTGELIPCDSDLADRLIQAELNSNVALLSLTLPGDLDNLLEYGGMSRIPLALNTDSPELLERALRIFPGRLLVDSMCEIDKQLIEDIAAKYGAIVF